MNKSPERTWEISDLDGTNKRRVTLAEFLAENERRKREAEAIFSAARRAMSRDPD